MAEFGLTYDHVHRRWDFSGSLTEHDMQRLELDPLDLLVIESPVENAADALQSLEIIFRRLGEKARRTT